MSTMKKYDLHQSPGYQLTMLARLNERGFEKKLQPLGLTRPMWCVLLALREEGLSAPSEIAEFIGIDRTATSRTLRQMEEKSFIERAGGNSDGRTRRVTITDQGKEALDQAIPIAQENAANFTRKLTQEEQVEMSRLVQKLLAGETRNISKL